MGKGGENEKAAIDFARLSLFLCRNEVTCTLLFCTFRYFAILYIKYLIIRFVNNRLQQRGTKVK